MMKTNRNNMPSDPDALPQLVALYERLRAGEGNYVMFGQQDAYVSGATFEPNRMDHIGKCDTYAAAGVYPSVAGFDVGHLEVWYTAERDTEFAKLIPGMDRTGGDFERDMNIDNIRWDYMREAIRFAHRKGAVVTVSWHSVNPLTGAEYGPGNRTWSESIIKDVLPGGRLHERFRLYLDAFAGFNGTLTDEEGKLIPYIFRPFHEHTGDWFWWGTDCRDNPNDGTAWSGNGGRLNDPEDFAALYRYAVTYLRAKGVHNVLWTISPDRSRLGYEGDEAGYNERMAGDWMTGYPGDAYVDLFGLDNYWDVGSEYNRGDDGKLVDGSIQYRRFAGALETVAVLAREHGKLAALTEMGCADERVLTQAGCDAAAAYTQWFLRAVKTNELTRRILYGLVWRTDFRSTDADPFAVCGRAEDGSLCVKYSRAEDFRRFVKDPFVRLI